MSFEKSAAEQAYSDLLHGPVPQTGPDFRRAIVQAVLIGRQLEADLGGAPWQKSPPPEPGSWEVARGETGFEPERVRVFEAHGVLWVEELGGATYQVDTYHHQLQQARWRKTAPVKGGKP